MSAAPIRLERDGGVAVDGPPRPAAESLRPGGLRGADLLPGRGRGVRRSGTGVAGRGRCVHRWSGRQRVPADRRLGRRSRGPHLRATARGGAPARSAADPNAGPRARPVPHGRLGGVAGLRHDLGLRVGDLRLGGGGGRAHAGSGGHPADGRAGGAGACPRVRDVSGHLRGRDAGALERRQSRRAGRRPAGEGHAVRPSSGERAHQGARGHEADRPRVPRGWHRRGRSGGRRGGPTAVRDGRPAACCPVVSTEGPGKATFEGR